MSNFSDFVGGGGSASLVDEIVFLNNDADTVTLADERVYLKGGVFETNLATYPLANSNYKGTSSFSVSAQDGHPQGVAWDGTHYWLMGNSTDAVYKYDAAGVYQSVTFSVSAQDTTPTDIEWDGTYFWVLGEVSNSVYKYNSSGVYQSVSWSTASQTITPIGMAWDGTYFWVVDSAGDVYKYNSSGVYQSVTWSIGSQATSPVGIAWDGTYFWGADYSKALYKYNSSGVYQSESITTTNFLNGVGVKGGAPAAASASYISLYEPANGIASDTSFGGQNYVRVK